MWVQAPRKLVTLGGRESGLPQAHFYLVNVELEKMLIFFFFFEYWRQRAIWVAMQPVPVLS